MIDNKSDLHITLQPLSIIEELSMLLTILTHNVSPDKPQLKADGTNLKFTFSIPPEWKERVVAKLE